MAGLGRVDFVPAESAFGVETAVSVATEHPVAACMASQYAGWQIVEGKYFAMGSGPMRAAAGKEALFDAIGYREQPDCAVGVLETRKFPPDELSRKLAEQCGVEPNRLTLLAAPTASAAGTVQIVARSVETALHKLFELGFDLKRVERGHGVAPLPPLADDDLAAIGRTNDAILYGGTVTLWVRGDDASLADVGVRVPQLRLARLWRAVCRHFPEIQSRLLCNRSALVQPGAHSLCESQYRKKAHVRAIVAGGREAIVWHRSLTAFQLAETLLCTSSCSPRRIAGT